MTVAELVELLQTFPPDADAGVLAISQAGIVIDVETAPVVTIEQTIADDGTIGTVWITGVGAAAAPPPSLMTWPCTCGVILTVDPHATWPAEHSGTSTDPNRPPDDATLRRSTLVLHNGSTTAAQRPGRRHDLTVPALDRSLDNPPLGIAPSTDGPSAVHGVGLGSRPTASHPAGRGGALGSRVAATSDLLASAAALTAPNFLLASGAL